MNKIILISVLILILFDVRIIAQVDLFKPEDLKINNPALEKKWSELVDTFNLKLKDHYQSGFTDFKLYIIKDDKIFAIRCFKASLDDELRYKYEIKEILLGAQQHYDFQELEIILVELDIYLLLSKQWKEEMVFYPAKKFKGLNIKSIRYIVKDYASDVMEFIKAN